MNTPFSVVNSVHIHDSENNRLATIKGEFGDPRKKQIATLFALAPQLLAALKQCRAELEAYGLESEGYNDPELNALIEIAETGYSHWSGVRTWTSSDSAGDGITIK